MKDGFEKGYSPPCAAMLGWSRVSATPHRSLFGSRVKHGQIIQVSLTQGEEHRSLGGDWFFGGGKIIAEVWMSPVQWAEFVSTPNSGSGVPCTVLHAREGEFMSFKEPNFTTESERMGEDYKDSLTDLKGLLATMKESSSELEGGRGTLNVEDRERLAKDMKQAYNIITDHLPFLADRFAEAMEKTVVEAKASVEAHVERLIHEKGLEALQDTLTDSTPRLTHDETEVTE